MITDSLIHENVQTYADKENLVELVKKAKAENLDIVKVLREHFAVEEVAV